MGTPSVCGMIYFTFTLELCLFVCLILTTSILCMFLLVLFCFGRGKLNLMRLIFCCLLSLQIIFLIVNAYLDLRFCNMYFEDFGLFPSF